MRIEPITNTNFKGLFTDKSAQNNGNWKMEYSPYSWEKDNTSKMARKEHLDIFASSLPDNEEIYTEGRRESSVDILGTESYYRNNYTGQMRTTISEVPAMNRETSLRVRDKKLDKFLEMKQNFKAKLLQMFEQRHANLLSHSQAFDSYSEDYDRGFWAGAHTRNANKSYMVNQKNEIVENALSMYDNGNQYVRLDQSMESVRKTKEKGLKEIKMLEDARTSGQLIDISRRDVDKANQPLLDALRNMRSTTNKILVLPNASMKLSEFLNELKSKGVRIDIPEEVIKYIDTQLKKIIKCI